MSSQDGGSIFVFLNLNDCWNEVHRKVAQKHGGALFDVHG